MYKWVIVKPRTNDDPNIITIWAPVLKLADSINRRENLLWKVKTTLRIS